LAPTLGLASHGLAVRRRVVVIRLGGRIDFLAAGARVIGSRLGDVGGNGRGGLYGMEGIHMGAAGTSVLQHDEPQRANGGARQAGEYDRIVSRMGDRDRDPEIEGQFSRDRMPAQRQRRIPKHKFKNLVRHCKDQPGIVTDKVLEPNAVTARRAKVQHSTQDGRTVKVTELLPGCER
jgi:hypothetical protein